MSARPLEYCCECDAPTGHAGAGDGSLYAGDRGPFCDECWSDLPDKLIEEIASLQSDKERLEGELRDSDSLLDDNLELCAQILELHGQLERASWVPAIELEAYDAGFLGDGGGGNIDWWHDYIRAELDRAHDFYQDQIQRVPPTGEPQ